MSPRPQLGRYSILTATLLLCPYIINYHIINFSHIVALPHTCYKCVKVLTHRLLCALVCAKLYLLFVFILIILLLFVRVSRVLALYWREGKFACSFWRGEINITNKQTSFCRPRIRTVTSHSFRLLVWIFPLVLGACLQGKASSSN